MMNFFPQISNLFKQDRSSILGNQRHLQYRVIFHLIRMKDEIQYTWNMNYDVGESQIQNFPSTYYKNLIQGQVLREVNMLIEIWRKRMQLTKYDIDALANFHNDITIYG